MNGNAPDPVLDVAPLPQDDQPQPRYYRVRPRHHRVTGALAAVVLVAGAGLVAFRSGVLRDDERSSTEALVEDAGALVPAEVPGVGETETESAPPPAVVAEVEFDVDSVVVVGDSITEASAEAIRATLGGEEVEDVDVHGLSRRRIEIGNGTRDEPLSGIAEIEQTLAAGADPDVWVIALGTNDVGQYPDEEAYGRLVDSILALVPADDPLVWVDVFRPDAAEHTAIFNEVLHERLDDRGRAAVAPWNAFASAPGQTILRKDRLHPNASGSDVFAAVIAAGIDDAVDD